MSLSRWKIMAGVLGISLGGLAAASQCPKNSTKGMTGRQSEPPVPIELPSVPDVPPAGGSSTKEKEKAEPTAPALPAPPSAPVDLPPLPTPTVPAELPALPDSGNSGSEVPPAITTNEPPTAPPVVFPAGGAEPTLPTPPADVKPVVLPAGGSEPTPPSTPPAFPDLPPPMGEKTPKPVDPMTLPPAPPAPIPEQTPSEPKAGTSLPPEPPSLPPPAPKPEPAPGAGLPPIEPPVVSTPPKTVPPSAPPAPSKVVQAGGVVSAAKFRILLRVGEGKPTFEVKAGDDLVLKVACDKVDITSPQAGDGPSEVKARGNVRFVGFGAEGTCEELSFIAGTGDVTMTGSVKIAVKDKLGRVESELESSSLTYRIDPDAAITKP